MHVFPSPAARTRVFISVCLAVSALVGCITGPPEARLFTLDMRPSDAPQPAVNLRIDRLRPVQALARNQLFVRKTPTEVEYYASVQWAGNLTEQVTQKLAAEFGPIEDGRPTVHLLGDILAFEQVDVPDGAEARVKLAVELRDAASDRYDPPALERVYETSVPAASPSPEHVVEALSAGLAQLAARIAADAASL